MKELEKYISPLVEQMFPAFYREEGRGFISFVKAYYEWMESSNNVLYHSKRLPDYADIDTTLDEFIVHFKEKYLKNIQFDVASNKQLFVKNALDFYRAKGSERAVDLFFRLIYGRNAEVYYPGDDIFKLSAGEWFEPVYLEVTRTDKNPSFVGKQITGTISGATAFVDRLVRRRSGSKYIDLLYISNISGDFSTDEMIKYDNNTDGNPKIIGSLSATTIISGGGDFTVGETVEFISNNGNQGKAYVNSVANVTGIVEFSIVDGGFGYNSNSQVLVSNVNLELGNIVLGNTASKTLFDRFETVNQKLANLSFDSANSTSTFINGEYVYTYYGNNTLAGTGEILSVTQDSGAANGTLFVAISGNLQSTGNLYSAGNTKVANLTVYTDASASANLIAYASNVTVYTTNTSGSYTVGEEIYQANSLLGEWANGVIKSVTVSVTNTVISIQNVNGVFLANNPILGRSSSATANLYSFNNKIGVVQVSNTFYTSTINSITTSSSNNSATLVRKNAGNNATFTVGNTIYNETNTYNTDFITSNNHSNIAFSSATSDFNIGDSIYRYYTNNVIAARAVVVDKTQASGNANGYLVVHQRVGNNLGFAPSSATNITNTFYTTANAQSAVANSQVLLTTYYGNVALNSTGFGFPKDPTANISGGSAVLDNVLEFTTLTVGRISTLAGVNPGNSYSDSPFVVVYDPRTYGYYRSDYYITYASATGNILEGEVIVGQTSEASAVVKSVNSSVITATRLNIFKSIQNGEIIRGQTSAANATVVTVQNDTTQSGLNAIIPGNAVSTNGSVATLRIIDSGIGYIDGETVTFYSSSNNNNIGLVQLSVKKQGIAEGRYKEEGGFLDANKYIHDGEYYQEYSYEVITALPFEKYSDMFKKVAHVAGTKLFGKYISVEVANSKITAASIANSITLST